MDNNKIKHDMKATSSEETVCKINMIATWREETVCKLNMEAPRTNIELYMQECYWLKNVKFVKIR